MASVYTIQHNNQTKTFFIIAAFIALVSAVGYLASYYFSNYLFAILAAGIALVQSGIAYFFGDKIALSLASARLLEESESPEIHFLVENLSKVAGIPKPKIFISPDRSANAFACGRGPGKASICLNQGILDLLDKHELEGVIAHELAHIKNQDTLVMTVTMVLSSVISLIVDFSWRVTLWTGGGKREENKSPILLVLYILTMIAAPILALLLQLAVSRSREYLADATAITFTRYPEGLISALQKLYTQPPRPSYISSSMQSLYIAPPGGQNQGFLQNLFSTHPSIEKRIAKLNGE